MIFVDASALVAILAQEPGADALLAVLEADVERRYSAISRWETAAALCKSHLYTPPDATDLVDDFLRTFRFTIVPIAAEESALATDAYGTYGRGRHPAALNMGDCFTYACAKSLGAALLYKGDDFSMTDLA